MPEEVNALGKFVTGEMKNTENIYFTAAHHGVQPWATNVLTLMITFLRVLLSLRVIVMYVFLALQLYYLVLT